MAKYARPVMMLCINVHISYIPHIQLRTRDFNTGGSKLLLTIFAYI